MKHYRPDTTRRAFAIEKMNDNRERRYPMGDKGKKDKDKGQKQKTNRQDQKTKNKLAKQPKRKP